MKRKEPPSEKENRKEVKVFIIWPRTVYERSFIMRTSKKGNEYKYYLPKEIQETIKQELKWKEKVS